MKNMMRAIAMLSALAVLVLCGAAAEGLDGLDLKPMKYPDSPFVIPMPETWQGSVVNGEGVDFYALESGVQDETGKLLAYAAVNTVTYSDPAEIDAYYDRFLSGSVTGLRTEPIDCGGHPGLLYSGSMQVGGASRPVYGVALLSGQDFLCLLYWGDERDSERCLAFVRRIAQDIRIEAQAPADAE